MYVCVYAYNVIIYEYSITVIIIDHTRRSNRTIPAVYYNIIIYFTIRNFEYIKYNIIKYMRLHHTEFRNITDRRVYTSCTRVYHCENRKQRNSCIIYIYILYYRVVGRRTVTEKRHTHTHLSHSETI
jgi:hypothetical protein